LTYGGFLQARQVGNQIWSILEQAKLEHEVSLKDSSPSKKRKRFKVVIHSSPFLRCIQTSVGISSGLAQSSPDSIYNPSDVIVPATAATAGDVSRSKPSAILRLDSFLGEWLTPEYFEMITPPPASALMLGGAKAELLRRADYTKYATQLLPNTVEPASSNSGGALWNATAASASVTDGDPAQPSSARTSVESLASQSRPRKGYMPPKPNHAVSSKSKIPDGIVEHARDACAAVDYQWDSMRPPFEFGDGGKLGEEWVEMHKRFRRGIKQLVNWYCTDTAPAEMVTTPITPPSASDKMGDEVDMGLDEEDVETVVVLVSHGAGCNALIGAITHQPVLMDVGIASITMATLKPDVAYSDLLAAHTDEHAAAHVPVHQMYDIRMSASTEHLQSSGSTPISSRSSSIPNVWNGRSRGRTSTLGSLGNPVLDPMHPDTFSISGSRSTSASATVATVQRRESGARRLASRNNMSLGSDRGNTTNGQSTTSKDTAPGAMPSPGLWSPGPSSLRFVAEGTENSDKDDADIGLPNFDTRPSKLAATRGSVAAAAPRSIQANGMTTPTFDREHLGPMLAAPIKLQTSFSPVDKAPEEAITTELDDTLGSLWSLPRPPDDAERFRDLTQTKRRWTVNERA
jgi:broad specificity phosphatase PhoE